MPASAIPLDNVKKLLPGRLKKALSFIKAYLSRGRVVYQCRSEYSWLQVIDKRGRRYLVFVDPARPRHLQQPEDVYQSYIDLADPQHTRVPYADYFHLAWVFNREIKNVLMIGLGGGTTPRQFLSAYPELTFTTVEIDPEVVRVAHSYFYLAGDPRHRIVVDDGRRYLQKNPSPVDLLLLDAFFSRTIPHHLFTLEFFQEVKSRLTERGVLSINVNGALTGPGSTLFRSIYRTLQAVFPSIYVFAGRGKAPEHLQNIAVIALRENLYLSAGEIHNLARELEQTKVKVPGYGEKAGHLYPAVISVAGVPVLSDACPPPGGELHLYAGK